MKKKLAFGLACLLSVSAMSALVACDDSTHTDNTGKYSVVFDTLGGSSVDTLQLTEGATITRPAIVPTKQLFTFDDWYTDKTYTEKFTFGGAMPANDITVYAGWTPETSVAIRYNANGGAFEDGDVEIIEYGKIGAAFSFTTETVSHEGYAFGGWYTDKACTQAYAATVYPSEGLTLYARWANDPNYAYISYYGNGELVAKVPVKKGEQIEQPELWGDDIVSTGWYVDSAMSQAYTFETAQNDLPLYTTYYTKGLKFSGNMVTGYDGSSAEVIVPSKYNGVEIVCVGAFAFYRSSEMPAISTVKLPSTVIVIQNGAFYDSRYLINVDFSSNVTEIGNNAFYNNVRLRTVGDMSGVTRIGEAAFAGCNELRAVELSSRLTNIGSYAFINCAMLGKVVLPETVSNVPAYAFSGCTSLKTVEITSAALNEIGAHAFENCKALEQVIIRSVFVPELRVADGKSPFADSADVKIQVSASALDEYKTQFGSLDDGALENKFVAIG